VGLLDRSGEWEKLYSFTIITTRANALLSRIHDRMPVIYDREMGRSWLEELVSDPLVLSLILQPVPSERLEAYEVSTLVNSPEDDSSECVRRVSQNEKRKGQLPLM
jgi:putative SOS response-associated peptidase YedK